MRCVFIKVEFKLEETNGNAMEDAGLREKNLLCCVASEEDGILRTIAEKHIFQG